MVLNFSATNEKIMEHEHSGNKTVFLHGWCGHADELEYLFPAIQTPLLAPNWMPAPGSFDLETWPSNPSNSSLLRSLMRSFSDKIIEAVRREIINVEFAGATLIGHSMGGALTCVLAADPALKIGKVILIDSSTPMPQDRMEATAVKMANWISRAKQVGRIEAQSEWVADCPNWVPAFFNANDSGTSRALIESRFSFAPVVEAAAAIGGGVQWPITESLQKLTCPIYALSCNPGRMPVSEMRKYRPEIPIEILPDVGHYPHIFKPNRVRQLLTNWLNE